MITQRSKLRTERRLFIGLLIALSGAFGVCGAAGGVFYVDDDAALGGDGRSWETAYKYLQDALYDSTLTDGDTIRVAAGTYTSDKDEGGNVTLTDRMATFQLVNGVALYGGYAGVGETNPDERNPDTYLSILSGDLAANDGPDFANNSENSYHVVTGNNTEETVVLDGLTITGGNADGTGFNNQGAGIFIDYGSPTITNCSITKNTAIAYGGGMYNFYFSNPTVTLCIFSDNNADEYGGGMENDSYCSPVVTSCTFSGNTSFDGGGIDNYIHCDPTVTDCIFSNNATSNGGGMTNWGDSSPIVTRCTFTGNIASVSGGGIYNNSSNSVVTNCIFNGNSANTGGAVYNYNGGSHMTNCTFNRNTASQYGGGIYNQGDSYPVITNCILWGNTAPTGAAMCNYDDHSVPTVNYSDVQGGWEGTGNLDSDPLFSDPDVGDFHLKSTAGRWNPVTQTWVLDAVTSPVIDRGDSASAWSVEPSPNGGRINMGVYGGTDQASKSAMIVSNNHPADYPGIDMRMIISEITAYGSSWKTGQEWPVGPNPIPINYLTRAGYLWKGGELYHYDSLKDPPLCWELGDNSPQFSFAMLESRSMHFALDGTSATITRYFNPDHYTPEQTVTVYIDIIPAGGTGVYAVEDTPPSGWDVSNINEGGSWDDGNRKVKWGLFFDDTTRTLSYNAVPPAGESGTKSFNGIFSDGVAEDPIIAQIAPAVPRLISGEVKTSGGSPISGVTMSGLPGNPSTSGTGFYSVLVSSGWSGTVTPSKAGFSFSPPTRVFSNVSSDQPNQDFTGTPTHTISGYVRTGGGAGISGVTMSGLPGNPQTSAGGYYSAIVTEGFSGTVTPTKLGYSFSPSSKAYSNVNSNQFNQNYTGTIQTYTISGNAGIGGAVMNGLPGNPVAAGNGSYTATVGQGWSGTVTPTLAGYQFDPPSRPYSNVSSDQSNQDYTATLKTYIISGYVLTSGGTPIDGVTMGGLPGGATTDVSGFYTAIVDHGWSDTVIPNKTGYNFNPPFLTYSNVISDRSNQNYIGTPTSTSTYVISGYVRTSGGSGLSGVTVSGLPGTPTTNGSGYYSATVNSGFSGTVSPNKAGYSFIPPTRSYSNVNSDQSNQDYTGTVQTYTVSGYVQTGAGSSIIGVAMNGLPGSPTTDGSGYYSGTVTHGWLGIITPSKVGYSFTPASRNYTDVTADEVDQDYNGLLQGPTILYVPSEYATIQAAINAAVDGDTVIVAYGTYSGDGNRDLDLLGKSITVKSNNSDPNACIIDCGGTEGDSHRGFNVHSNEVPDSIIEGFTIVNGYTGLDGGGGIYCENSSPTIRNCVLRDHITQGNGGGIACIESNPVLERCKINGNTAGNGGGVYARESDITIDQCILQDNWSSQVDSSGKGGGIYIQDNSSVSITSSKIIANSADSLGGGICSENSSLLAILNSLITGNVSGHGGAAYIKDSDGIIINSTMHGNVAGSYGGAIRADGLSVIDIYNSICWENSVADIPDGGQEIALASEALVNVFFSDVKGSQSKVFVETGGALNWGDGNLDINPHFMNPGYWHESNSVWIKGEYSLLPASWCIDAGDTTAVTGIETDIVGNTRIIGADVDVGAYEYIGSLASSMITIKKMNVKAGKIRETEEGLFTDSFTITGFMDADVDSFTNADTVSLTIGPWSETIDRVKFVKKGKKSNYVYKGPSGGITVLKLNFDKGTFTITGKQCNLIGLTAPAPVILIFSDFYGYTAAAESVISGNKLLPVQLLTSYMNFLRVKKVVCKPGEDNNIENVTIQGSITALDDIDLTATGLIIYWGAEPCEIAKEEFTKKNSKYIAKVPSSDTDPFSANISIDFTKCEFKIVLKKTSIPYQASPVWFGLECGSFVLDVEVAFKE